MRNEGNEEEKRVTAIQTGESVTKLIFCEDMSATEGGGFEVLLDIRDGRTLADDGEEDEVDTIKIVNPPVESQKENTRVSIRPLPGRRNEFTVDFSTRHYAFSCCRSQTVRSLESFYQLHTILKTCHLYAAIPSLPLKPILWVTRSASQAKELAVYLSQVLQDKQLLSNKALHLFLQTRLSMEVIRDNLEGLRDDEVLDQMKPGAAAETFDEHILNANPHL